MKLPYVKSATIESIIQEVYAKNETFGLEEFVSSMESDNIELGHVLYSFIEAIAEYMGEDDIERVEECIAIAKISCNLMYKSLEKQVEIDEMNYEQSDT